MSDKKSASILLHLVFGFLIKSTSSQENIFLNLNTKKVSAVTGDKFLSFTLDPAVLLNGDVLTTSTELSTNMAKALAPGYVRLAGPRSNFYNFERSLFPQGGSYGNPDLMFSEAHWVLVQQWAQRSGLEVVTSLNPQRIGNEDQLSIWDSKNSLDLISFSDHMGYNMSWQLGYECQDRCQDISGFDLGQDIARLKNILSTFPRYSNSIIAGPDILDFREKKDQQFIQDYLNAAGNSLSVITWHPNFAGVSLDSDGVSLHMDTLAADRDLLFKSIGRSATKKPLWIAESKPEECKKQFLGALVWARRLGNAAQLGVQVIMRQPDASNIVKPTPDYWVSLLHKMLVGKEVLDVKLTSGNKTNLHFYCQCTKPSGKYERGAITVFGINLTPGKVSVALKGLKIKTLHKYILMPGYDTENRMFAETVLLNNEPLAITNGNNIPEINPVVYSTGKNTAVKLPSGGIGFWVIPGARVKSCLGHDDDAGEKSLLLKKLTKKLEESEIGDENLGHELEDDFNHNQGETEVESVEDNIKNLFKSKIKNKRKYHKHSDENDDDERRFRRIDAKRDFEKLEKLWKRNNNEEKKSSHFKNRAGIATIDSGEREGGNNSEEDNAGLMKFKKNGNADSGEDIRAKLEEYKKKLENYEGRKNNSNNYDEMIQRRIYSRRNYQPGENDDDAHNQKALEALALISKVENTIRDKSNNKEEIVANRKSLSSFSDLGEEMAIDGLANSEKIKRTINPKSFGGIRGFLVSNDFQKMYKRSLESLENADNLNRNKRDLDKLLGDDPLGLRKEGLFKKRLKNDEVRERRLERRNRKREKDDIGLKKELPGVARFDPRIVDSGENNFFGFPPMKPLENFPEGDIFINEGSFSEEDRSHDYDYVKDDDDEEMVKKNGGKKRSGKKNQRINQNYQHETWVEEPNSNLRHAPNEFFERVKLPAEPIKTQWKDHGELYEPESLREVKFIEDEKNDDAQDSVIARDRVDETQDKEAKETVVKRLKNYYENSETFGNDRGNFENGKTGAKGMPARGRQKFITERTRIKGGSNDKPEEIGREENTKSILKLGDGRYDDNDDLGSLEFVDSKPAEDYSEEISDEENEKMMRTKKRTKRRIANLDVDVFGKEMINEDAGNSKDCRCRVIRKSGKLIDCKDCRMMRKSRRRQRDVLEINNGEDFQLPVSVSTTDVTPIPDETDPEKLPIEKITEASEIILGESQDAEDFGERSETASPNFDNEDKKEENLNQEIDTQGNIHPALSNSGISKSTENSESGDENLDTESDVIYNKNDESEISGEDLIGSPQLNDEKEIDETLIFDGKNIEDDEERAAIDENIKRENKNDDNYAKRHIPDYESSDLNSLSAQSGTKISLGTGSSGFGSSAKVESRLKNGLDLNKLKLSGFKGGDSARNKLILNTEALSALIKENEGKKSEVFKALESSTKLKAVDNSKYLEYQKKRADKLSSLKDKLKERKAKILQQYRQELLDALTKCDDEVERNLKRREIWYDFDDGDFVDEDKVAYLMMNRPVDYERVEDGEKEKPEERKYFPKIDAVQPLPNIRERKIPSSEYRRFFYAPLTSQIYSSSEESSYENDETYYAMVEDIENPKIFNKRDFLENERDSEDYGDSESEEKDSGEEEFYQPDLYEDEEAGEYLVRNGRHLLSENSQSPEETGYKIIPINRKRKRWSPARRGRDTSVKKSNYVCLRDESAEDFGDDDNRLFKLIKNQDHYEAVAISQLPENSGPNRERKDDAKVRNKRRKYSKEISTDDRDNYYPKNYRGKKLSPEEYELLMLIPVRKQRTKRHKRDLLDNEIDRSKSFEKIDEPWDADYDLREKRNKLQDYLDAKEKGMRDFKLAQDNLNNYLREIQATRDPIQLKKFKEIILNFGSDDREKFGVVPQTQDEVERIQLQEYLKGEILKKIEAFEGEIDFEKSMTPAPGTSTSPSLFDLAIPKLKNTINEELEEVGRITESFEDFINEFDNKFNDTETPKDNVEINNSEKEGKISPGIFRAVINGVKRFFDFITGVSLIFH